MTKLPKKSDYPGIIAQRSINPGDREFTYFLKIPFGNIAEIKISVANRTMVNLGSGLVRHLTYENGELVNPNGVKIIEGRLVTDKSEKRVFHWPYDKHMEQLGIKDKEGKVIVPAYLNGWRDLGQNPAGHILWESNPGVEEFIIGNYLRSDARVGNEKRRRDRLVRLAEDEEYGITRNKDLNTGRVYSCLVVPKKGKPFIRELRFDENQEVYDSGLEKKLTDSIEWAASGKPVVRNGAPCNLYDIVEQYYDVAHIFPVSDAAPEDIDGRSDRPRKGELVKKLYQGYPEKFKENCIDALNKGLGGAEYYFDVVGVNEDSLMILQMYGGLREVAKEAVRRGMKDAILVDEGGSVATWAWYHGPNGGYENCSSYLRPSAISVLGIRLIEPGRK